MMFLIILQHQYNLYCVELAVQVILFVMFFFNNFRVGLIEWMNHTIPLKQFLHDAMTDEEKNITYVGYHVITNVVIMCVCVIINHNKKELYI